MIERNRECEREEMEKERERERTRARERERGEGEVGAVLMHSKHRCLSLLLGALDVLCVTMMASRSSTL